MRILYYTRAIYLCLLIPLLFRLCRYIDTGNAARPLATAVGGSKANAFLCTISIFFRTHCSPVGKRSKCYSWHECREVLAHAKCKLIAPFLRETMVCLNVIYTRLVVAISFVNLHLFQVFYLLVLPEK